MCVYLSFLLVLSLFHQSRIISNSCIIMKRLLTALLALVSLSAFAQDIIICRNGDEISSKVLKISKTEIEYKKWSNQDGPTYTLEKAEVFMVKYQNGEKDVFKEEPATQAVPTSNQTAQAAITNEQNSPESDETVLATPAANNAELIAQYNTTPEYVLLGKKQTIKASDIQGTLGVTTSSILSTDDIEISFAKVEETYQGSHYQGNPYIGGHSVGETTNIKGYYQGIKNKYAIMIKNKTSRAIYVDKAACLGAFSTGKVKKYFDPQESTVIESGKSGAGASVNLGTVADAFGVGGVVGTLADAVNIGGDKGKMSLVTTTYKDDRILVVPPHASVALSTDSYRDSHTKKNIKIVTGSYEYFDFSNTYGSLSLKIDESKSFTEVDSPEAINYMITYSFDKELSKCFIVNFGLYLKDVFGASAWNNKSYIKATSPKTIVVM